MEYGQPDLEAKFRLIVNFNVWAGESANLNLLDLITTSKRMK